MKFGKRLKHQIEESLPQWRDKFLAYKELKQVIPPSTSPSPAAINAGSFVALLNGEIEKLNSFFLEQEEEFIIRLKELQDRIERAAGRSYGIAGSGSTEAEHAAADVAQIRRDIVNLHGEMVLLLNYSGINYIGLGKILKKYDKRTGGVLRLPVIDRVLKQPFFTTELISKLVKECEVMMAAVFPASASAPPAPEAAMERRELAAAGQSIFRNTVAALMTMREVRSGSSTYGQFSLPPLSLPDSEWLQQSFQPPAPPAPPSPIPIQ